jgi:hypothetical protein
MAEEWSWLKTLFPPEQWAVIILITLATVTVTQVVKRLGCLMTRRDLSEWATMIALPFALAFGWWLWPAAAAAGKIVVGLVAWLLADRLAKYGLRFLRWWKPELYVALNGERRRARAAAPAEERRAEVDRGEGPQP